MNNLYVLVNVLILAAPLALSFDKKVAFFRKWGELTGSIVIVGGVYIAWDVIVTDIGHWSFNPEFAGSFRIAGLPLGEIMFFVTVPYACIFIYEVARAYFPLKRSMKSTTAAIAGAGIAVVFVILALLFRGQGYTFLAMLSVAVFITAGTIIDREMWLENHTWLFFLISYIPFLIANGVLTALPIVEYNSAEIWNFRVYTIPLEDFFYNFAMLGFFLLVFRLIERLRSNRRRKTI